MKDKQRFSLRFYFTLVVMAEITFSIIIALLLLWLFNSMGNDRVLLPLTLWQIMLSILIGGTITTFLSRWFFDPITKLSRAMRQVASGDFKVRLETDSSISEIQELYSNFNLMAGELGTTEILQTDFVSNVSHEFKTPISAIEGYATLLQDERCKPGERRQYTDKILLNTRRLSELVGNILLLSRLDNQSIQGKKSLFRLDEQIRQAIVLLEPKWSEKDIEFDVELESLEYTGSEALLFHVWSNLIGNAVKFNSSGGYVGVRLERKKGGVRVQVDDNGPGIPEESLEHIFDKFYQSDSSHKSEGNGLGLALVKRILVLSGGSICAENLSGGGCRFTVFLPM